LRKNCGEGGMGAGRGPDLGCGREGGRGGRLFSEIPGGGKGHRGKENNMKLGLFLGRKVRGGCWLGQPPPWLGIEKKRGRAAPRGGARKSPTNPVPKRANARKTQSGGHVFLRFSGAVGELCSCSLTRGPPRNRGAPKNVVLRRLRIAGPISNGRGPKGVSGFRGSFGEEDRIFFFRGDGVRFVINCFPPIWAYRAGGKEEGEEKGGGLARRRATPTHVFVVPLSKMCGGTGRIGLGAAWAGSGGGRRRVETRC